MNLFLIGPMGAGKTTIGRALAKRLRRDFFDSDHEIVARSGVDIPTIFEFEGEAGFRERETQVLESLCELEDSIIATGGGVVLSEYNRQLIARNAIVVYLHISVEEQLRRTAKDRNRPLLQTPNVRQRLQDMAAQRGPLYSGVADIKLVTDRKHAGGVINQLCQQLAQHHSLDIL